MDYTRRFRATPGHRVSLAKWDPADHGRVRSKAAAARLLQHGVERLALQQEKLYAQDTWAVLIVLQAMDAAGKDSTIKHVMSGVNPQGCEVHSFKQPSTLELDHDYLWRSELALPERGRIGIHNRSYYEEVIITRVHPEVLARQQLPGRDRGPRLFKRRFRQINEFEQYLVDNGVLVLKFFLHVSKDEQRKRFLERLDNPAKWWKFSLADVRERGRWDDYMAAYEDMLTHTSTTWAPWYIVPADHKWFTRLVVADIINGGLDGLALKYPTVAPSARAEWKAIREALEGEAGSK